MMHQCIINASFWWARHCSPGWFAARGGAADPRAAAPDALVRQFGTCSRIRMIGDGTAPSASGGCC